MNNIFNEMVSQKPECFCYITMTIQVHGFDRFYILQFRRKYILAILSMSFSLFAPKALNSLVFQPFDFFFSVPDEGYSINASDTCAVNLISTFFYLDIYGFNTNAKLYRNHIILNLLKVFILSFMISNYQKKTQLVLGARVTQ